MKIIINHDTCKHGGAYSERCLAATLRSPMGHERYCTAQVVDDGQPETDLTLIEDGQTYHVILRTREQVEIVISEGVPAIQQFQADQPPLTA